MVSNLFFHCVGNIFHCYYHQDLHQRPFHPGLRQRLRHDHCAQPKLGLPIDDMGVLPEHYLRYAINWDRCTRNMAHAKIYLVIFPFCWLQITVLKVSSIIIPIDSDAFWSHNWRSKAHTNNKQPIILAKCFCFKKLKIDYSA